MDGVNQILEGEPIPTQCTTKRLEVEPRGNRRVVADFDGGPIASGAGPPQLREVDRHLSVSESPVGIGQGWLSGRSPALRECQ